MFKKISTYITGISITLMATLVYQLYTLPGKINPAISKHVCKQDTVIKVVSSLLQTQGNFVYFEGKLIEKVRIKERFIYDIRYPSEIFDGWFTLAKAYGGGNFYIWSSNEPLMLDIEVKGYFFTDNISRFNIIGKNDYIQVLYPIVGKQ